MSAPYRDAGIIIGCGALASAIAVHLHRLGFPIVMCDDVDPGFARRGMAFTDAWYVGNADLDGTSAVFCSSVKSIPTVLTGQRQIAATTWSWQGVAAMLLPRFVVDASEEGVAGLGRKTIVQDLLVVRVGVDGVAGHDAPGAIAPVLPADDSADQGANRARASRQGRFTTAACIGQQVRRQEVVGCLDREPIVAPATGVLRGLPARGARIATGMTLVEVDPRGDPSSCFGIECTARDLAHTVERVLADAGIGVTPFRSRAPEGVAPAISRDNRRFELPV
jgi:xanthine dehydrogenase accessory factor